jgi:hypothetical protein
MIDHPVNESAWASMGSVIGDNILVEQYLLAACIDYHRQPGLHRFRPPQVAYLFQSWNEAFDESAARTAGYTHLIGGAKANRHIMQRLERRVRRDFPQRYDRVSEIAKDATIRERAAACLPVS